MYLILCLNCSILIQNRKTFFLQIAQILGKIITLTPDEAGKSRLRFSMPHFWFILTHFLFKLFFDSIFLTRSCAENVKWRESFLNAAITQLQKSSLLLICTAEVGFSQKVWLLGYLVS
jgi:hypothetical protein